MTAGLRIRGTHGVTQVDTDYKNDGMVSSGTLAMTLDPAAHPQPMRIGSVTVSGYEPVIAFAAANQWVNLRGVIQSGSSFTFHFAARSDADFTLSWWIFDVAAYSLGASAPLHLVVRDLFGTMTFHGGVRPLRVVDFTTAGATYPAGRTYAVIQSSQALRYEIVDAPRDGYTPAPGNKLQQNRSEHAGARVNGRVISCALHRFEAYETEVPSATPEQTFTEGSGRWLVVDVTGYGAVDQSDYTLNPVNWPDMTQSTTAATLTVVTENRLMSGVTQQVALRARFDPAQLGNLSTVTGAVVSSTRGDLAAFAADPVTGWPSAAFTVNPGEQIAFRITATSAAGIRTGTVAVTVYNVSDGDYAIDTFAIACTVDSDDNHNVVDVVPNPISFSNLNFTTPNDYTFVQSAIYTVSGINQTITLRFAISSLTETMSDGFLYINKGDGSVGLGQLRYAVDGAGYVDIAFANGADFYFLFNGSTTSGMRTATFTVTVTNRSNGNAVLGSFACNGTVDHDDNFNVTDTLANTISMSALTVNTPTDYQIVQSPTYYVTGINSPITLRFAVASLTETVSDGYLYVNRSDGSGIGQVRYAVDGTGYVEATFTNGQGFYFLLNGFSAGGRQTATFTGRVTNRTQTQTLGSFNASVTLYA